jgi:hypothetical protein
VSRRKYKSGTSWCFWRWTDVDSEYITRLHILKTPWFAVCLHWFHKPDPEPYQHDHPVTFLSLILRGWYTEWRNEGVVRHNWYNWIRATPADRHTIIRVAPRTLTLCFMGPKTREWGFHLTDRDGRPTGWIMWKDYYAKQRAARAAGEAEDV